MGSSITEADFQQGREIYLTSQTLSIQLYSTGDEHHLGSLPLYTAGSSEATLLVKQPCVIPQQVLHSPSCSPGTLVTKTPSSSSPNSSEFHLKKNAPLVGGPCWNSSVYPKHTSLLDNILYNQVAFDNSTSTSWLLPSISHSVYMPPKSQRSLTQQKKTPSTPMIKQSSWLDHHDGVAISAHR